MQRLTAVRTDKNSLGAVVSYLMVTAVALRGLVVYPEVRGQIASLLVVFIILMRAKPRLRRQLGWGQPLFIIGQIGVMVGLFLFTPTADFWAVMLLPACSYVMRRYRPAIAWLWITAFIVVMSIMIIIGQGWRHAPEFVVIYVAAYLLMGSYALMLRQTQVAHERSHLLAQQLQRANAQLQEYVTQVEELTTIKERNRLARELHDAVTQSIFSMTLITRSALILLERDPEQVKGKLLQLQELAQGALQEMRGLIYQLRSLSVEEDGLYPVLHKLIDGVNGQSNVHLTLEPGPAPPLPPAQQQELYRIIQEAVNNIVKHARADNAAIRFAVTDMAVIVTVTDDGVGFDHTLLNSDHTHIGLDSMRERAEELGGSLAVTARPGAGTEIRAIVPISEPRNIDEKD